MTNAFQVSAVPQPIISNLVPMPWHLTVQQQSNPAPQDLAIFGDNFLVQDSSLRLVIGGNLMITNFCNTNGGQLPSDSNGKLIVAKIDINDLKSLKPGTYKLTVITSGGAAMLSNAVVVDDKVEPVSPDAPVISNVFPKHAFLFTNSFIGISGKNFKGKGEITVLIGSQSCKPQILSDSNLLVTVPPFGKLGSSNEIAQSSNAFDINIISPAGVGTKTNAITFDLTLPGDPRYWTPLTPQEQEIEQAMHGVFYTARVMGTNPVLQTDISVAASVGDKGKSGSGNSSAVPNITATLTINSNTTPVAGGNTSPPKTNALPPIP